MKNNISIPRKVIESSYFLHITSTIKRFKCKFRLSNCLSGSVKVTKNDDLDKHKYTGDVIVFGSRSECLFTVGSYGKNVIIFGTDMS